MSTMRTRAKKVTAPLLRALTSNPMVAFALPHDVRAALAELCALVLEMAGEIDQLRGEHDGS